MHSFGRFQVACSIGSALALLGSVAVDMPAQTKTVIQTKRLSPALSKALERGDLKIIDAVSTVAPAPGTAPTPAAATSVPPQATSVELTSNKLLGARNPGPATAIVDEGLLRAMRDRAGVRSEASQQAETAVELPLVFGIAQSGGSTVEFRPHLYSAGLMFNADSGRFEASVHLELRSRENPNRRIPLPEPVRLRFLSEARDLRPDALSLEIGNGEPSVLHLRAPVSAESVSVRVFTSLDTVASVLWLRPQPTLILQEPPDEVEGYGVEGRTLTVRLAGPPRRDTVTVSFVGKGSFDPREVTVVPGRSTAETRVSFDRLGRFTVQATAPGFGDGSAVIAAVPPMRSLTAALLGAVVGAAFMLLRQPSRTRRGRLARLAALALLGALIATAAYIGLGVNLLQLTIDRPLTSSLAIAAFAALGAALGTLLAGRTKTDAA